MGAVSPNGIGNEAFCRAVLAGTSGVSRITASIPATCRCRSPAKCRLRRTGLGRRPRAQARLARGAPRARGLDRSAARSRHRRLAQLSLERSSARSASCWAPAAARRNSPKSKYRLWLQGKIKQVSLFCIPSGTMGTLSSEVSMRFGLRGMSHVITTGCTSSTDALGYALRQIQFGFLPDDAGRRRGRAHRARHHEGLHAHAHHDRVRGTTRRSAPRGRSPPIATASWWPKAPGCSCWKSTSTRGARRTDPGRSRGLRLHLRGLSSRSPAGMWRRAGARHSDGDGGCRHSRRRRGLRQPARHLDPAERPHRNPGAEAGAWATRPTARRCRA